MMESSIVNRQQANVLSSLIQRDLRAFSTAKIDGTVDGKQNGAMEVRKKLMGHLEDAWHKCFQDLPTAKARQLAHKARDRHESSQHDLTYGEVTFGTLAQILCEDLKNSGIESTGIFYDLGSGTGRGVIGAALIGSFDRVCGVEMISELHEAALGVKEEFVERVAPGIGYDCENGPEIKFVEGNLLRADWSDADVVFINSTCFSKGLMEKISQQADRLRPGACIITLTQPLTSSYFEILKSIKYDYSWGTATTHIQVRSEKPSQNAEQKTRYWSKKIPGKKDFGALFDGYTSA